MHKQGPDHWVLNSARNHPLFRSLPDSVNKTNGQETKRFQYCCMCSVRLVVSFFCCLEVSYEPDAKKSAECRTAWQWSTENMLFLPFPPRTQKSNSVLHISREILNRASERKTHGFGQMKTNLQRRKIQCCGLSFRARVN